MFIDTHMHIGDTFGIEPDKYVENAINNDVKVLIASFCEKDDLMLSTKFVDKYKNIYCAVGYHPEVTNRIVDNDLEILENLIKSNKKIVAIGEIGLDYHYGKENISQQQELFKKQLSLAEKLNLPVVIHTRDAIEDTYQILKNYKVKGVMHCFSGSYEMAKKFIDLGFLLGIGGVVTFKNSKLYQVIEKVSLSNIVLETDSPYMAPEPFRGKTNESAYIPVIAQRIADVKNVSLEEVKNCTTKNAISMFDLESKL